MLFVFCGSAQAATFIVDSSGDASDATPNGTCLTAGGVCTLRAAIEESNSGAPAADMITFTAAAQPTINLTGALPDIVDDLTIAGPGAGALTVRRNTGNAYRIFTITGDWNVAISGMTVTNGLSDHTTTPRGTGGAIAFSGTSDCSECEGFFAAAAGDGSLTLSAVTVTANTAAFGQGASGGGVSVADGTLTITESTISDNVASSIGSSFGSAAGGGIFADDTVLTDVTLDDNHATASGPEGPTAEGGGIYQSGSFHMVGGEITDNTASATDSEGLYAQANGGGARMLFGTTAVLMNVTVSGNEATATTPGSANIRGGGIYGSNLGSFEMSGSTISANTASATSTSQGATADGGGLDVTSVDTSVLTNSTVSGNKATASGAPGADERGGGVFAYDTALDVTSATLAFNEAATGANLAVRLYSLGTARVRNSIVSDPVDGASCLDVDGGDVVSDGFNLSSDASCDFTAGGDQQSVSPQLGLLADNGGPTFTRALALSSPAVDQGSAVLSGTHPALTTDQRAKTRPVDQASVTNAAGGEGSDIGAFELEAQTVTTLALTVSTTGSSGQGYVDSSPTGIDCGTFSPHTDCANDYATATPVTLTAHASAGTTFTGFSGGGCAGAAPCVVTMTQARSVTVTFTLNQYALTVSKAGTGQGYVDSAPTGIDCGTFAPHNDCTETYNHGQAVTLSAHASTGSTFTGFSGGGCTGTAPCAVAMTQARSVTATFALKPSYSSLVLGDHPQGYWRFGEALGGTARDETANHNDGTYINGPVLGVPGALTGDANKAARLDGVNDYIRAFNSTTLGIANTFTVEGWIKRATATKVVDMIVKDVQITVMNSANANQIWVRKPGVSTIARSASGFPVDSAYHHVVVTKNASGPGAVKFYIDGVAVGTVDVSPGQVIANSTTPLVFGSSTNSQADFDEFAIYNQVLTPGQIQAHYAAST